MVRSKSRHGLRGGAGQAKNILRLYSAGVPVEEIARRLNMGPAIVEKTLRKNGLSPALYGDVDVLTGEEKSSRR